MKRKGAHLGQHFLHAPGAISAMVDAAHIDERTTVLEIGPGKGVLTHALLARAGKVIAIEKDSGLASLLRETFAEEIASGRLMLIEDDIRSVSLDALPLNQEKPEMPVAARRGKASAADVLSATTEARVGTRNAADAGISGFSYSVVANIPYYITGEIMRMFLTADTQPERIVLLIQKEVAERIVARDDKESILSLSVKAFGNPRIVRGVPRGAFRPAPAVDSAILAIENVSRDAFSTIDEARFFRIVKTAFASKRKMLAGNLRAIAEKEDIASACEACGIAPDARAEDVPLPKWLCLTKNLRLGDK